MATDSDQLHPPSSESREAGYETSTVSIKGLAIFLVCLVVAGAVIHFGAWVLFTKMLIHDEHHDRSSSALTDSEFVDRFNQSQGSNLAPDRSPLPPPPRLQPTPGQESQNVPAADLEQMYQKEDAVFTKMGWKINAQTHVQEVIPKSIITQVIQTEAMEKERRPTNAVTAHPTEEAKGGTP